MGKPFFEMGEPFTHTAPIIYKSRTGCRHDCNHIVNHHNDNHDYDEYNIIFINEKILLYYHEAADDDDLAIKNSWRSWGKTRTLGKALRLGMLVTFAQVCLMVMIMMVIMVLVMMVMVIVVLAIPGSIGKR